MDAKYFSYDGISSRECNIAIGSFDGGNDGEIESGNAVTMTTVKSPNSAKFLKADAVYNDPLQISWSVIKLNCQDPDDWYFTQPEIAFVMRWLVRKDYKKLTFDPSDSTSQAGRIDPNSSTTIMEYSKFPTWRVDGETASFYSEREVDSHQNVYPSEGTPDEEADVYVNGWEHIFWNARLDVKQYLIGGRCAGFNITATCDAPWGYGEEITHTFYTDTPQNIKDTSDEIGIIYPTVILQIHDPGTKIIENSSTGTQMIIKNCVEGETITIFPPSIQSTECIEDTSGNTYGFTGAHQTLMDDFNWVFLTLGNELGNGNFGSDGRTNVISASDVECTIKYNPIKKAVI